MCLFIHISMHVCRLSVYVCCLDVRTYVLEGVCPCMCLCGKHREALGVLLLTILIFLDGLLLHLELTLSRAWLANKPCWSPCPFGPSARVMDMSHLSWLLCGCWGPRLRSSSLCNRYFPGPVIFPASKFPFLKKKIGWVVTGRRLSGGRELAMQI